jgi:hypothetical protein
MQVRAAPGWELRHPAFALWAVVTAGRWPRRGKTSLVHSCCNERRAAANPPGLFERRRLAFGPRSGTFFRDVGHVESLRSPDMRRFADAAFSQTRLHLYVNDVLVMPFTSQLYLRFYYNSGVNQRSIGSQPVSTSGPGGALEIPAG